MRITQSNDISDQHIPVKVFFNAITDDSFIRTIENLSNEIGAGFNEADCSFSTDLDPSEEPFDGVMFSVMNEEIIVDYKD